MWNDDDLFEVVSSWLVMDGIIGFVLYAILAFIGLIVTIIYLIYMAIMHRKEIKEAFIKVKNKVVETFEKLKEKKGGLAGDSSD